MQIINWQQFGLKKNPYDILPLIEGGELPINKAFVGRINEREFLNSLFESEYRLCLTICGNIGVGKTSLANFHKFLWKYLKNNKPLFSFRREIEVNDELLNKKNFLIEIIGSVLREIQLLDPGLIEKNRLLNKLNQIVDISQSLNFAIGLSGGFAGWQLGGNIGGEKPKYQPIQLSATILEQYFVSLIEFIKKEKIANRQFSGLIIHVNNFDVVISDSERKKQLINFFNEIRDMLQTPNVYFLFLGPNNLFKDIISTQKRVKSIFCQTPLKLNPLSKTEIIEAFDERMQLLKSENISTYIKPVEDDVVFRLYDLYKGDIRAIMSAISDILGQYSEKIAKKLSVNEAMFLLGKERWERVESNLTDEQKKFLKYLVKIDRNVSQKEVSIELHKARPNISGYYFKPLIENGIIEEKEVINRTPLFGLTVDYEPLIWLSNTQKELYKTIKEKTNQLSLFSKK